MQEDEPEFAYIANMHGNEPVGMEMSLYFINELLSGYGTNTRYTDLVNNTELWIVPLMNPDGLQVNTRENANGDDLNRSFPDAVLSPFGNVLDGPAPAIADKPVEVRHLMNFSLANNVNLSANFHTGALVTNYPYDANGNGFADYAICPDDALYRELSLTYSRTNAPMYNSPEFTQGITNGDEWYEVYGGMQDWNYRYTGNLHVTVELSNSFRPAAGTLPTLWNNNRDSMLNYASAVNWGIRGIVTNVNTGAPIRAKVTIVGNAAPVFTDGDIGDYHRVLLPGTYSVTISAPGYVSRTFNNIGVVGTTATRLDVKLSTPEAVPPTNNRFAVRRATLPIRLDVGFSEYVLDSMSAGDFTLTNLSTNSIVPIAPAMISYATSTNVATLSFAAALPDGRFRLSMPAGSLSDVAGNALASAVTRDFTHRVGDTDGNGTVGFNDLLTLAQSYGQTGKTFDQGDFNYDGAVNFIDLLALAQGYGVALPGDLAPMPLAGAALSDQPVADMRRVDRLFTDAESEPTDVLSSIDAGSMVALASTGRKRR